MRLWTRAAPLLLLPLTAGCAARPAYFGSGARLHGEGGGSYWEESVKSPPYLQARMRRPRGAPAPAATLYEGALSLVSVAPGVVRSTFSVAEGSSASFHYDFNSGVERALRKSGEAVVYSPGALDVVVACARGECRAAAAPSVIGADGTVALTARTIRDPALRARIKKRAAKTAARADLRRDDECAILHERLRSFHDGGSAPELKARREYDEKGCDAWLEARGGVGAAQRRVRLSQWTSLRGD
jgi:hypothetical protein